MATVSDTPAATETLRRVLLNRVPSSTNSASASPSERKKLRPAQVAWQNEDQIRRMSDLVGLTVIGLKRIRIGRVVLGHLPLWQWLFERRRGILIWRSASFFAVGRGAHDIFQPTPALDSLSKQFRIEARVARRFDPLHFPVHHHHQP